MEFIKYTFTCDPIFCDALLEFTCRDGFDFPNGTVEMQCPCGRRMNYITTEQKEAPVETTEKDAVIAMWRQELELTYGNQITELQNKLSSAEQRTESYRQLLSNANSQLGKIIDNMTYDYWYNPNTEASTILEDLCEILDHTPKKEINFTATMRFTGRMEIDLADWEDFDIEEALSDAYVEISNGDVVIDECELYDANEC